MLPNFYDQSYQEFVAILQQLEANAKRHEVDALRLRQIFQEAQHFFGQRIMRLDASELEPRIESRVRSYHTEIDKQLRLLGVDLMFLQAARQPETASTRKTQVFARIQTLISYCDALLEARGEG